MSLIYITEKRYQYRASQLITENSSFLSTNKVSDEGNQEIHVYIDETNSGQLQNIALLFVIESFKVKSVE